MKLSELSSGTKKTTLVYNDHEINLEFNADFYTPAVEAAFRGSDRPAAALVEMLCGCLRKWDVTDDKDKMIRLTPESLFALPTMLLDQVAAAIFKASSPNPENSQG